MPTTKRRLKISDDVFYKNLNKQRRTVIPNQRESDEDCRNLKPPNTRPRGNDDVDISCYRPLYLPNPLYPQDNLFLECADKLLPLIPTKS